jgi:hypothetical protein
MHISEDGVQTTFEYGAFEAVTEGLEAAPILKRGVDYSTRAANWTTFGKALLVAGRTFVGRYLQYSPSYSDSRCLNVREAQALSELGIRIFTWWENSPQHVGSETIKRATQGRQAGIDDAHHALESMGLFKAEAFPVFYTVDTDAQVSKVLPYFQGVHDTVGVQRVGVYAGYRVTKALFDAGLVKYAAQPEAWSYMNGHWPKQPVFDPRAQMHQWTAHNNPGPIGGIRGIDGLDCVNLDNGTWLYGGIVPPSPTPEEEDDMYTDKDRERDIWTAVRVLNNNFAIAKSRLIAQGALPPEITALEAKRLMDVRNEWNRLDPEFKFHQQNEVKLPADA